MCIIDYFSKKLLNFGLFFLIIFLIIRSGTSNPFIDFNLSDKHKINDTIYIYDTVYYYDTTIIYDTVRVNNQETHFLRNFKFSTAENNIITYENHGNIQLINQKNPLKTNQYLFSFDISLSPAYAIQKFSSDLLFNQISEINSSTIDSDISNLFGLGFNFHKKSSVFSSGIQLFTVRENFNFLATKFLTDTILDYEYFIRTELTVDSVAILNIDTLLATGDSVYFYIKDTDYISFLDSNIIELIDTLESKYKDKSTNRYRYIEIPLIYSYTINRFNYTFSPEIGIITSFFVNSKGKIVSLANHKVSKEIKDESDFSAVNLSLYTGFRLNYKLSYRYDFFTTAFYRRNINSIFRNYPVITRFNSFGFNFGIRYKFID